MLENERSIAKLHTLAFTHSVALGYTMENKSKYTHWFLHTMQQSAENHMRKFLSTSTQYEEHASMSSHVFQMRDLE